MKSVMLVAASLFCFSSVFAETKTTNYLQTESEVASSAVVALDGITMTFGPDTWKISATNVSASGNSYTHYAGGSNNPKDDSNGSFSAGKGNVPTTGAYVIYEPQYDGTIEACVVVNANKATFIVENTTAITGYDKDGNEVAPEYKFAEKYQNIIKFDVKAGNKYYLFCTGSKMGYYGFSYTYEEAAAEPVTPTLSDVSVVFEEVEGLTVADTLRFTFTVDCAEGETVNVAGTQADMACWALVGYGMQGQMYAAGEIYPVGVSMENPVLAVTKGTHTVAVPVAKTLDYYGMMTFERVATPATTWGLVLANAEMEFVGTPVEGTVDIPAAPSALEFATTGYTWVDVAGTDADTLIVTATVKVNDPAIAADSTFYVIPYSGGDQAWIGSLLGVDEEGKQSFFFYAAPANLVNGGVAVKAGDVEIKIIVPKTMEYNNKIYTRMAAEDELVLALATVKVTYDDWFDEYKAQTDKMIPAAPITVNIPAYVPVVEDPTEYLTVVDLNFRDADQFPKDVRVEKASLTEVHTTLANGIALYKSTNELWNGLVFEPAKDDGTQSWWLRPRNTGTDYGLAAINQTRWFGITDLHAGYRVTVESKNAMT